MDVNHVKRKVDLAVGSTTLINDWRAMRINEIDDRLSHKP
jgi:hypothetical protein